ncbi:MAG: hypothetical protein KatS3mg118_1261 [Paracoccaceae bacterium]|nr:MAG: hypothetical protein KatS3mg118_1261 [Paracoccaceae bacterium]
MNWARGLGLFDSFAEIDGFDRPPAIARGVVFVPALAGLACPHWDRRARGAWLGLGLADDRRDLMQAVLEGIALRTAEVVGAMDAITPVSACIPIDGGMTRNRWFCQFLADCLGRTVLVSDQPELTALGTAILAAEGAGMAIGRPPAGRRVEPRAQPAEWIARFAEARRLVQDFAARG